MKSANELRILLRSIDHKGYPAYKSLTGSYQFDRFSLFIDHVQGDPFASPSHLHVEISHQAAGFSPVYYERDCSRIALQDFLLRRLVSQFDHYNFKAKGSGKSGLLSTSKCGQEVFERSACEITSSKLIVRFQVGFPAFGRTICAEELEKILFEFLPRCIQESLFFRKSDQPQIESAVFLAEDQQEIRTILKKENLIVFVANGSILPRKSGVSDLPLPGSVPFLSPASMERTFLLPHHGEIKGMAIPRGITLIVGGGYHGKSTLLEAIQLGIYNHIRGDGREFVITDDTAVKLRAEDGRCVKNVDISLFINDLPNKKDTASFSTADASGSTSQASIVMESIEAGSRLFLIDEDTSATNFMVRDELMQQVICREKEPITPFFDRIRDLYEQSGISTILVAGSSGAFFYIADRILQMDCYRPIDITEKVKTLCSQYPEPKSYHSEFFLPDFNRVLPAFSTGTKNRHQEHMKIKAYALESFSLDKESVNVRYLEQLTDSEQTTALAYLLRFGLEQVLDGKKTVQQVVHIIYDTLEKKGWEAFCSSYIPCGLVKPRIQELFACLNRFRG